ncbi:MAG: hypothetical protein ACE3JP_00280 [Ectobacillus sp.]
MTICIEESIWEELQRLYHKVWEWEKKLEEQYGSCDAWTWLKHLVYLALIIAPAVILLSTLCIMMGEELK